MTVVTQSCQSALGLIFRVITVIILSYSSRVNPAKLLPLESGNTMLEAR